MFRMKFVALVVIGTLFSCASFLFAEPLTEVKTAVLEDLVAEALINNPQIQAAYNNWQAAEHKIKQVSSLPDPMARYAYFGKNVETRVGPQEAKYGLSQKVPFPGKLELKGEAQAKRALILKEKYEAAKREVVKNVNFVYYDIFWVDKAVQIVEEEKSILQNLEKVAQRRYESNLAPQQDVVKAQVELSKIIERLFILSQNRKALVAKMNALLNRTMVARLDRTGEVAPAAFEYQLEQLHKIAQESRQELLAANLDIERAEYEKSLAKLDYFPDFTFGVDYIQIDSGHSTMANDGEDAWMGMVAINVPIWFEKLSAKVKEKRAVLESRERSYRNIENRVASEVEDLYFKITTYRDIVSLYKTALIPQTEQAFQTAKIAYEAGTVDFLNWLESEKVLLRTRLAYYKAIVDYQKSIAYLERVVGRDL